MFDIDIHPSLPIKQFAENFFSEAQINRESLTLHDDSEYGISAEVFNELRQIAADKKVTKVNFSPFDIGIRGNVRNPLNNEFLLIMIVIDTDETGSEKMLRFLNLDRIFQNYEEFNYAILDCCGLQIDESTQTSKMMAFIGNSFHIKKYKEEIEYMFSHLERNVLIKDEFGMEYDTNASRSTTFLS